MTLNKWKKYNQEMMPKLTDLIILLTTLLICGIFIDLKLDTKMQYTYSLIATIASYEIIYITIWTISVLITAIIVAKRKRKNDKIKGNKKLYESKKTTKQIETTNK